MTNILTQAEIDELLNALSAGEEPARPLRESDQAVRPFDFRMANKFPKEQIRTLNIVFGTFAQQLGNKMGSILRASCECELLSIEEISFNEFNNSLPAPVVLAILTASPLGGSLLFEVSPEAAYMAINRLLGGTAKNNDSSKQFTEIEIALIERVLRQCMRTFDESWSKVLEVHTALDRIETSTQFAQIVALNEPVAVATLNLRLGEESGLLSVCISHTAIEPVAKQLNTRLWFSGAGEGRHIEAQGAMIGEKLLHSKVTITALFEETPATVSDVVSLQVGDVIRLSHRVDQPLMLKLHHIPKFKAEIGTSGLNYAVQVAEIIKGENHDDDVSR